MKENESSRRKKVLQITERITSAVLVIAAVLKYKNIWFDGLTFAIPLLGVLQFVNGILHWKSDRDMAAYYLIFAGFIFLVCIGVLCM